MGGVARVFQEVLAEPIPFGGQPVKVISMVNA
jgi:hypothetical protein